MSGLNPEQTELAAAIAAAWYQTLAENSGSPPPTEWLKAELLELTRQIIALSSNGQFQADDARAIGARLARLGYKRNGTAENAAAALSQTPTLELDPRRENSTHIRLGNVLTQVFTDLVEQQPQTTVVEPGYANEASQAGWKNLSADQHELQQKSLAILHSLPDSLGIIDREGEIHYYHAGSEREFIPGERVSFKNIREYLPADLASELLTIYQEVIDSGLAQIYEYTITIPKLGKCYFQDNITPYLEDTVLVISRDITKLKRIEEELRASEARFRSVVEDQSEFIARWTPGAILTFVNKAVCTFMGMGYDQLIGSDFDNFLRPIDEDEAQKLFAAFATMTPENPTSQGKTQILLQNQEPRWLEWRTRATYNEQGEAIEFQTVAIDITDIKRAQDELRNSEARYRSVVDTQNELIGRYKPDGTITFVNQAAQRLFGIPYEAIVGHNIFEFVPEVGVKIAQGAASYADLLTPQNPSITDVIRIPAANGEYLEIEVITQAIFNTLGVTIEYQTSGRDISELKRMETALRESEERYRSVIEVQTELIGRILPDGTITFANEALCRFFSKTRQDLLGRSAMDLIYAEDKPGAIQGLAEMQHAVPGNSIRTGQGRVVLASGDIRWTEWTIHLLFGEDGSLAELQCVGRDNTALKLAQETLEQQNELLHQLNDQLINIQEIERQRIARDLHDSVLNELGAMMMAPAEKITPQAVRDNYEQLITQLRQTINGLRSPMLNYGLHAALEDLLDSMMDNPQFGSKFTMDVPASLARFDPNVEMHLFRIIQQACDNALQHAQAQHIRVYGKIEAGCINLTVEDDGIGFQLGTETDLAYVLSKKHFGLVSMLERGKLTGAEVQIISHPGAGTLIRVLWEPQKIDFTGVIV